MTNSVLQNSKQRRLFTKKDLKDLFTLKADNGSIVAGAEGITETTELTKGEGYVDPDSQTTTRDNQQDDGETMRTVLKSRGLAGIFDHDVVEGKSKDKRASVREMEAKAKRIAREALQNLQQSVTQENSTFGPGSRFGGGTAQSNNLLSSIAKRNTEIMNAGTLTNATETKQNTQLLKDLQNFVRIRLPTTDEILVRIFLTQLDAFYFFPNLFYRLLTVFFLSIFLLNSTDICIKYYESCQDEFSSYVSTLDAAVFRKLLKSIATLNNGRWKLK